MLQVKKHINLTPEDCLNMTFEQSFNCLKSIISEKDFDTIFNKKQNISSPVENFKDAGWCKNANIVGINPRLCKTLWGIVKYAMSFPENAIHIMPLWEAGDKGSLYVQNSWSLNNEFFDTHLEKIGFRTIEEQLRLVINVMHAMGKVVGFDALPHVDNFSEIVLSNPRLFEWVKLTADKKAQLFPPDIDYNLIYKEVENIIIDFLNAPKNLFDIPESERNSILFSENKNKKLENRIRLMQVIKDKGYSPIPVVEHAPIRPVLFDKIEYCGTNYWASFSVRNKANAAKIIGCVTPYKWYKIDKNGYPEKDKVDEKSWIYYINKINKFQQEYNFDFLRADMAHIQHSHSHSQNDKDLFNKNELLNKLKSEINKNKPYFSIFAEAFYGNYYINGIQDMMNKNVDIVLGYMNYKFLNDEYIYMLKEYLSYYEKYSFYPCMCIYTNDGDLPEHNKYFQSTDANIVRYFISTFMNLPSYMGMGFETRNPVPEKDCEFSNEFVKYQPFEYKFGENYDLYNNIAELREIYEFYYTTIKNGNFKLLKTDCEKVLAWYYSDENNKLLFVVNLDIQKDCFEISDFDFKNSDDISLVYTNNADNNYDVRFAANTIIVENFGIAECAIFKI